MPHDNDNDRPRWPDVALALTMMLVIIAMLVVVLPDAIEREQAFNENIREDRCARWGENVPPELLGYCTDRGV